MEFLACIQEVPKVAMQLLIAGQADEGKADTRV